MKIALIGYGKMGRAIERIALERGHEVVCRIDIDNQGDFDSEAFKGADVAIEFTTPATAVDNYRRAMERGVTVVSGSTGWTDRFPEVEQMVERLGAGFFWASNFSIGVNVFMGLNRYLSRMMADLPQYTPRMKEIHHIHKLDHPSGTAITLAEGIIGENHRFKAWSETPADPATVVIDHEREGEVPGTHIITWDSPVDTITIEHKAKSRDGFALGAVMAAEWMNGRKGLHGMDEMMDSLLNPNK